MRTQRDLVLTSAFVSCLVGVFSGPASAADAAQPKLTVSGLATLDAAVRLCVGVDPVAARGFEQLKKAAIGGQSERDLAAMQSTPEYAQVYSLVNTMLAGAPHDWAVTTCKNVITMAGGKAPPPEHDDHDKGPDKGDGKVTDKNHNGMPANGAPYRDQDKGRPGQRP